MDEIDGELNLNESESSSSLNSTDEDDVIVSSGSDSHSVLALPFSQDTANNAKMGLSGSHQEPTENDGFQAPSNVTFNRNLPVCHEYMGTDLEEVMAGQNVFEADCIIENVPLLPVPNFILMPNQILPLNNFHPRLISMFRTIIASARSFGVVNLLARDSEYDEDRVNDDFVANVGTLAEVLAFKEETDHEVTLMKMRVVGRQRFKILSTQNQNSVLISKIKILPDIEVGEFINCIEPSSSVSFRLRRSKNRSRQNNLLASIYLPAFVRDMYDTRKVVIRVVEELKQWYDVEKLNEMSKNPVAFSFWVASNLPIKDDTKIFLLSLNCTLQRIRFELSLLHQCTAFFCRVCEERIGRKNRVFSMSYMGPLGVYVNPYGSVHEILTLSSLETPTCVSLIGRPNFEYSWFPGYAWTIFQCKRCETHLGWRFTCEKNSNLSPKEFWGLARRAIHPIVDGVDLNEQNSTPCI